ncbi:MAG: SDR family oxidoreductase [Chloroflexi bacterium]|nr:SDR family oxidoreductase [Chloroflexota bacterium]
MNLELSSKTAIVTGGSRGIGKAIARELALEGADVAIVARTPESLEAAARELAQETGRRIVPIPADTGDDDSVRSMVQVAANTLGHLDILVNCAAQPGGIAPPAALAQITNDAFWPDMNIKVMGYLRCAREVAPYMAQRGWGRIINISGLAARQAGSLIGSMRNVAVVAMTKNLAEELGPHGINVTVVHPGTTRTERTPRTLSDQAQRLGITVEEVERRMAQGNSVRRIIDAQEIAYVVAFLASPKSVAINGDVIAAGGVGEGPSSTSAASIIRGGCAIQQREFILSSDLAVVVWRRGWDSNPRTLAG